MLDHPGRFEAKRFISGVIGWIIIILITGFFMWLIMGGPINW
jgi:cobalamin biosynthesis protein CobD/CbiB